MNYTQKRLLDFITKYQADNDGVSPSFEEMAQGSSKSVVHRQLRSLEEQGYIRRLPHRSRAIEVITNPTQLPALYNLSNAELAKEAHRRGMAIGHAFTDKDGKRRIHPLTFD